MSCNYVSELTLTAAAATAFAFVEYSARGEAAIAVQHASRMFEGYQVRIEHKVAKRSFASHNGSPVSVHQLDKNPLPAQTHEMLMMLYHRGVEFGLSQAVQAQAVAPHLLTSPVYGSFPQPYYPHYDGAVGIFSNPNGAPPTYSLVTQPFQNGHIATSLTPSDYHATTATATASYVQPSQTNTVYTPNAPPRDEDLSYTWPPPAGDHTLAGSSTFHYDQTS